MGENIIGLLNQHDDQIKTLNGQVKCNTDDITDIKVHNAKYDTKLDTTNKILIFIAGLLGTGIAGLFFQALSR